MWRGRVEEEENRHCVGRCENGTGFVAENESWMTKKVRLTRRR